MKIIYDNEQHGYLITLEDFDKPLFINTDDIVEVRDYLVEHMVLQFNNALQEQLSESDTDERYEDWCFDCDYCKDGVCEHNINCENGEMWAPKDFDGDFVEEDSDEDDLVNVAKDHLRDYLDNNSTNGYDFGDIVILSSSESPCDNCSNNPKNGGSGICHCTLGSMKFTC